ncbi:hypothetical protein HPULCUR_009021 [Helicostylum pulchrum]|uniref:Uncharacterized protein n=1 Tax=Helicostylum pulchrum TaxID=562976 RepID=A0ABP9Y9A1_9FUNG
MTADTRATNKPRITKTSQKAIQKRPITAAIMNHFDSPDHPLTQPLSNWEFNVQQQLTRLNTEIREGIDLKVQVQRLLDENHALKTSLVEANAIITGLLKPLDTPSTNPRKRTPPPPATAKPTFAAIANRPPTTRKPTIRKVQAATRIFETSTYLTNNNNDMTDTDTNSGPYYQYVHLPLKYRDKISMVREKLRILGVDNGRILDLHYPTKGV